MNINPENESKDERIPVAVPASIKAWVRDRARLLGTNSSELVCNWIIEKLREQEGIRICPDSIPELLKTIETLNVKADKLRSQFGMVYAGLGNSKAKVS
jgi:hypothetical protein